MKRLLMAVTLQLALPLVIDKTYDPNFANKHIVEQKFSAALSLELPRRTGRDPAVSVGADVRAEKINVTLRNVHGHARFHATTEQLTNVLRAHALP